MMRQLNDGMMARVIHNGLDFEASTANNRLKQGCVLAPTSFSVMFSAMIITVRNERLEICIAYRTDEHLLNSQRIQAPTCEPKTCSSLMIVPSTL
ncbi:unnamed protein product [Schistocephalus solidus]|uniref:Reverse transcriptase domain-containing protein n=1 Tax=Schistocephalus solidus TaxID=70667 RepID=A0A183SH01_SCHSO|nr:unnamed protein product [Schistocephalus solidus]